MNGPCSDTCILIPTYNNAGTVGDVISRCRASGLPIYVVDDGSDDATAGVLAAAGDIQVIRHPKNKGKGVALKTGFIAARKAGYSYVITIDADGQHFPEDIPAVIDCHLTNTDALVVGSRNLTADNMPSRNTFANKFSNFWFHLQTGIRLEDTQSGFRLYPLGRINLRWPITPRYEAELELLVFSAWRSVPVVSVPVRVYYPPEGERVSHFRPFWDFFRITVLNSVLTIISLFTSIPVRLWKRMTGGCCNR